MFGQNGNNGGFGGFNPNSGPIVDPLTGMRHHYTGSLTSRLSRHITLFSFAAALPMVQPTVGERNINVDYNQFCAKSGLNPNGQDKAGSIAAAAYSYIGINMPASTIAQRLGWYGMVFDSIVSVKKMLREIMKLAFAKTTVKTTVKTVVEGNRKQRDGRHNRQTKRSERQENYTISLGTMKEQLLQWALGLGTRAYVKANTIALHDLCVAPAVRSSTEAYRASAAGFVAIMIGENFVIVDGVENVSIEQIQTALEGMVSDETIHDIDSPEHQVPFSRGLNLLVQQGWAPVAAFGIKDAKAFKATVARSGLNKAYALWNDGLAMINEVNPKIQTNASAIRKLVKDDSALTPQTITAIREKATTVLDDVTTSRPIDSGLVGVGVQASSPFASSLGLPASFQTPVNNGYGTPAYGTPSPFSH